MAARSIFPRISWCIVLSGIAALGAACTGESVGNPRPDATVAPPITCATMDDCGGTGLCVAGICQSVTPCTQDNQCASAGQVCHSTRGYCVQCDGRHANECAAGQTCQFDFTCVVIGGSDGGVRDAASSARCRSSNDCPTNRPECNVATGECFGGDSCVRAEDCSGRPGCGAGACVCTNSECRARPDECTRDEDCLNGAGTYDGSKFCTLSATPKRCLTATPCSVPGDCSSSGLICDASTQRCRNGRPCPIGNECNAATEACVSGTCAAKNCINTPSLCQATETCNAQGMCVPQQSGSCTSNANCGTGYYCDTQVMTCKVGCRGNSDCQSGICTAAHTCQGMSGGLCGPCNDDNDCPSGARCVNNPFSGKLCYESCSMVLMDACTANPAAQCVFGNCSCFL